ncbi:helix-turn-helix domain-containing protein [Streptomyces uncialis]|uniref:helix-turn-helix domain-containing protein n=1 Tax=Streptomyces uncialis TaxID=1048205 RepID=UPI0036584E9F
MTSSPPQPTREGQLLKAALENRRLSARKAAKAAGISEGRWRQIVNGYQTPSKGVHVPAIGSTDTIARMAQVVGVTPEQLEEAGREDSAAALRGLLEARARTELPETLTSVLEPYQLRTILSLLDDKPRTKREKALLLRLLAEEVERQAEGEQAGPTSTHPDTEGRDDAEEPHLRHAQ